MCNAPRPGCRIFVDRPRGEGAAGQETCDARSHSPVRLHRRRARAGDASRGGPSADPPLAARVQGYTVIQSKGEIISFTGWDTPEQAEAAATAATSWVAENAADDLDLKETMFGEVLISTTLGIGITAGATA